MSNTIYSFLYLILFIVIDVILEKEFKNKRTNGKEYIGSNVEVKKAFIWYFRIMIAFQIYYITKPILITLFGMESILETFFMISLAIWFFKIALIGYILYYIEKFSLESKFKLIPLIVYVIFSEIEFIISFNIIELVGISIWFYYIYEFLKYSNIVLFLIYPITLLHLSRKKEINEFNKYLGIGLLLIYVVYPFYLHLSIYLISYNLGMVFDNLVLFIVNLIGYLFVLKGLTKKYQRLEE